MTSKDLIYQSIHIITEYYNNNLQPFFDNISEDILWIGPAEKQEIRRRDKLIATFSSEVHELTFTMGSIRAIKGFIIHGIKKEYGRKMVLTSNGKSA